MPLNSADWIAFYFGVLKTGAVAVTLSGVLTGDELVNLVNHSRPRFLFTVEAKLKDLEKLKGLRRLEKAICSGGDLDLPHLMEMGSDRSKRSRGTELTQPLSFTPAVRQASRKG